MLSSHPSGLVVVDRDHIKELFSAPDSELNFLEAKLEHLDLRYTFKLDVHDDWHIDMIRNQLTQKISSLMPDIVDELTAAIGDELDLAVTKSVPHKSRLTADWTPVIVHRKALAMVSRMANRVFVGLPLCTFNSCLTRLIQVETGNI